MLRFITAFAVLAGLTLAFALPASAQQEDSVAATAESAVSDAIDAGETMGQELIEGAEEIPQDIQNEVATLLEGAASKLRNLETSNVVGIGAGIVAGAVLADLAGGGGLFTLGAAAVGGLVGNWVADEYF